MVSSIFDPTNNSGDQLIPWVLGSLFQLAPAILSSALLTSNEPRRSELANEGRTDKGKGKAQAADLDETDQLGPEPAPFEEDTFADTLREAMMASRRADSRIRSPDEAGPSGSSASTPMSDTAPSPLSPASLPRGYPSDYDSEQAEISHAILMSSIEHIENALLTLRANFTFPTRLDCRMPPTIDSPTSSPTDEDANAYIVACLPTTTANSIVLKFVQDLRGLLLQLDQVDSKRDIEAESMKAKVAGVIKGVLENFESEVEDAIGRWMSLQATDAGVVGR